MRPGWSNGENTECGGSILHGLSALTMPDSEAPLLPPAPVPALHPTYASQLDIRGEPDLWGPWPEVQPHSFSCCETFGRHLSGL